LIHNPESILFAWGQDESEGAAIQNLADGNYYSITENKWENYAFLSPIGTAINLTGATHVKFNEDGAVLNFKKDGKTYYGVHSVGTQRFMGYLSQDDKSILTEHSLLTAEFETEFNQKKYTGIAYAEKDKEVLAYFNQKDGENYLDCLGKATWKNETVATSYTGIANPPFIPEDAVSIVISGNQCVNYAAEGVRDGVGKDIFINLRNVITEEQKPQLVELANYFTDSISNKKFAFYGYGLEDYYSSGVFNEQVILYLKNNKIYSKGLLKQKFPYIVTQARDFGYIFSNKDLWADIPAGYNQNSKDYIRDGIYEYSLADLKVREEYFAEEGLFRTAIMKFEKAGDAQPLAVHENYKQYVEKWGTDAALFSWAEYASRTAEPVLKAFMAYRFLPQLISEVGIEAVLNKIIRDFGAEEAKRFIKGALMEAAMYYSVAELLDTSIDWEDFTLDVTMAGLRNTVYVGEDMQAWAACLQGIELNTVTELIRARTSKEAVGLTLTLSAQCVIPLMFEKFLGNSSSDLYMATQRSSTTKLTRFFNNLKLSQSVQAELLFQCKNIDALAGSRGSKWVQEVKRLIPTEQGSRAFDLLLNASFDITKLSWRNFERLSNIVSKLDDSGAKSLEKLFKGSLDVNRMLIYLEKSGSSLSQYTKAMDDIVQKNLFSGTITISGGKTISKLDFVNNYVGEGIDLVQYYHKEVGGKQYFLKYHPASNQGAVIVMDTYSKVISEAESKIIVNITQKELQSYNEQMVYDE